MKRFLLLLRRRIRLPRFRFASLRKYLVFLLLVPAGYLFHVCVMPYFPLFGVVPNLLYAVIGIVTVAYGRLRAFWVGLAYGLVMEVMLPSVSYLNLALYTVPTLFCAFIFSDRSIQAQELDRAMGRKSRELPAWLRTVLCAMSNTLMYETVNVVYIFLGGSSVTYSHILRALLDVALTGALTFLVAMPVRRLIFGKKLVEPVLKNTPLVFGKK